jgi:hypothetical protein
MNYVRKAEFFGNLALPLPVNQQIVRILNSFYNFLPIRATTEPLPQAHTHANLEK